MPALDEPAMKDFTILPISEVDRTKIVSLLAEVLGPRHTEEWFRWKHLENPFGPSLGWVAVDGSGILGIRLFMRWDLFSDDGRISAVRPVDTVTAIRSRMRGVFRTLTEYAVEQVSADPQIRLIFNTPNMNSRTGYARMGWRLLPEISHAYGLALFGGLSPIEETDNIFEAFAFNAAGQSGLRTVRTAAMIAWRYRSSYGKARLREADSANGMIYRVATRRGIRLLILYELAGTVAERKALIRSVAVKEKAFGVLVAAGAGALEFFPGALYRRGSSLLAVRPLQPVKPDPLEIASWRLTLGDLEGVI